MSASPDPARSPSRVRVPIAGACACVLWAVTIVPAHAAGTAGDPAVAANAAPTVATSAPAGAAKSQARHPARVWQVDAGSTTTAAAPKPSRNPAMARAAKRPSAIPATPVAAKTGATPAAGAPATTSAAQTTPGAKASTSAPAVANSTKGAPNAKWPVEGGSSTTVAARAGKQSPVAKGTTAPSGATQPVAASAPGSPGAVKPGAQPGVEAKAASAVVVTAEPVEASRPGTPPADVKTSTPVEERINYQYSAIGRRDPFAPMVGMFVGDDVGGAAPVDVGGMKVVGIVWGADQFAMVEDGRGNSMILRRGDKVMNGYVEDLKRDAVIVKLTSDGQSQSVELPLIRKGDQSNASR